MNRAACSPRRWRSRDAHYRLTLTMLHSVAADIAIPDTPRNLCRGFGSSSSQSRVERSNPKPIQTNFYGREDYLVVRLLRLRLPRGPGPSRLIQIERRHAWLDHPPRQSLDIPGARTASELDP